MNFPQLSSDFTPVQILDNDDFSILFSDSSPMRVSVLDEKRATRFKVEDGGERSDHIVKNAIELNIELIASGVSARSQFQAVQQAFDNNRLVIVQTKMRSYENMLIESFPHEETQQIYDGVIIPLRLIEWRTVNAEFGELLQERQLTQEQVAQPEQSSTVNRGTQTGQTVEPDSETARRGSVLSGWGLI